MDQPRTVDRHAGRWEITEGLEFVCLPARVRGIAESLAS